MDLALNNLQRLICHKTQPTNKYLSFIPNFMVPSKYLFNIKITCLHTVKWFQVTNNNLQ